MRFSYARLNACLRKKLSMARQAGDTLTTTFLETASCFAAYFEFIYCADSLFSFPNLPTPCQSDKPQIVVTSDLVCNPL